VTHINLNSHTSARSHSISATEKWGASKSWHGKAENENMLISVRVFGGLGLANLAACRVRDSIISRNIQALTDLERVRISEMDGCSDDNRCEDVGYLGGNVTQGQIRYDLPRFSELHAKERLTLARRPYNLHAA
jgi:hypothetical protein